MMVKMFWFNKREKNIYTYGTLPLVWLELFTLNPRSLCKQWLGTSKMKGMYNSVKMY